jgi:hypothetical protein
MRDNGRGKPDTPLAVGAIIERPDAHLLVCLGMAVPDDEECRIACGLTDAQIAQAIKAQDRVSKGIEPQDYGKFDRGEIAGYREDGSYLPGPNAVDEPDEENDTEEQ